MAGRVYTVSFLEVAASSLQDLFSFTATPNMAIRVRRLAVSQRGLTTPDFRPVRLTRFSGGFAAGVGGSVVTPVAARGSSPAATFTARANDTTPMSGGTSVVVTADDWAFQNGYLAIFGEADDMVARPNEALAFTLPVSPPSALTISGHALIEELY
ncbi:MAG TPA: hypothetical protein VGS12_02535 [Caulobacteraceae bacterium]|nr:hypothetical protein [Caulobacteraceae bacterium]